MKRCFTAWMVLFLFCSYSYGQDKGKMQYIEDNLEVLAQRDKNYQQKVDMSVSGITLKEFLRALATTYNIILDVSPHLTQTVTYNFSGVTVADLMLYLCRTYRLDAAFQGNILTITAMDVPSSPPVEAQISYKAPGLISFDLEKDTLYRVFRKITELSGCNLVYVPQIRNNLLSGYIRDMPLEDALEQIAYANNLVLTRTRDNYFMFEPSAGAASGQAARKVVRPHRTSDFRIIDLEQKTLSVDVRDSELEYLVEDISRALNADLFVFSPLSGRVSIKAECISFENLLESLLATTPYAYDCRDGVYIIGERGQPALTSTAHIALMYRSVDSLAPRIPKNLTKDLQVHEDIETNSLIVSGAAPQVRRLEEFIHQIDTTIPVILIEVMIININKDITVETGIDIGIGEAPVQTQGQIFPSFDLTFGASAINRILGNLGGFGTNNIGKVTPNFYASLRALEQNGNITIHSTPRLSTLNGHKASLHIGNSEYYVETRNDYYGSQTPISYQTKTYKEVKAELSIEIRPMVSQNEQVTLDITVKQSDFKTTRIEKDAPPGTIFREFNSLVRVGDQEMIILGGLEESKKNNSSRGVPLLSRIPVLKWLFSSKTNSSNKGKLSIFIKPTILK